MRSEELPAVFQKRTILMVFIDLPQVTCSLFLSASYLFTAHSISRGWVMIGSTGIADSVYVVTW